MSFEERERFARELEEGGGDSFDQAVDLFRSAFAKSNGFAHSGKDEDAIWSSLDFESARLLAVGEVDVASGGSSGNGFESATFGTDRSGSESVSRSDWLPSLRPDLVFPTLKEELKDAPEDRGYADQGDAESGMDYVLILPSIIEDARDFAFHALFFQHVRIRTDIDFRDT